MATSEHPAGARLLFWVGRACRSARIAAGVKTPQVAALLGRGTQVVDSFELGKHAPRELDTMLAIYGTLTNRDPRDLVEDALALWRDQGTAPEVSPPDEAAAEPRRRMPSPPPAPQPRAASGARPKRRRKAS